MATRCQESWSFPSIPWSLSACMPEPSPLPGAGRSPETAAGSRALRDNPQPEGPEDTASDAGRLMGRWASLRHLQAVPLKPPFPEVPPLTSLLTTPQPDTTIPSQEYLPGALESRKKAQPGVPAPSPPFPQCPPVSETLHEWRGSEPHGIYWVFSRLSGNYSSQCVGSYDHQFYTRGN